MFENYKREEMPRAGAGDYWFEVLEAKKTVSKNSGNNMLVVSLLLNGTGITVKDYFVEGEWFNRNITSFFDATNIEDGDFELLTWTGAVGAAKFKEDDNGYLRVHYYLNKDQQSKLPEWQGEMPERQTVTEIGGFEPVENDDDLPF